jgi:hypothetical protein
MKRWLLFVALAIIKGDIIFNSSVEYNAATSSVVETNCHGDFLVFQNDGNLVLRTPRSEPGHSYVWDSQTYAQTSPTRAQGTTLRFQNDGENCFFFFFF